MGRGAEKARREARRAKRKQDLADAQPPSIPDELPLVTPEKLASAGNLPERIVMDTPLEKMSDIQKKKKEPVPTLASTRTRRSTAVPARAALPAKTSAKKSAKEQKMDSRKDLLEADAFITEQIAVCHVDEKTDTDDIDRGSELEDVDSQASDQFSVVDDQFSDHFSCNSNGDPELREILAVKPKTAAKKRAMASRKEKRKGKEPDDSSDDEDDKEGKPSNVS